MTRPDHLPVLSRRSVRYARSAGAVALAAALGASLAGCNGSSKGPSLSSATVTTTPTSSAPSSASAAVAAQAKALLARLHFAEGKLAGNYSWVAAAGSSKSTKDVLLFSSQRTALSNAHGSMSNDAHAARSAAQATPRNCPVVASQRQAAYAAYNNGVAAYNSFVPAANAALAALGHTAADRAAVQSAFNEVKSFAAAHPEASINMSLETNLAFAHSAADDKTLTDAVHAAQSSLASTYADLQKLRGNVANIAPTCG